MSVLIVVPNKVSLYSFFYELYMELVLRNIDIHFACAMKTIWKETQNKPIPPENIYEVSFARGMNPYEHIKSAVKLRKLVSSIHPEIVHAHFSSVIFTSALANTKIWPTTIGTFHGVNYLSAKGVKRLMLGIIETWSAERMDETWVLNNFDYYNLNKITRKTKVNIHKSCGVGCNLVTFNRDNISKAERNNLLLQLNLRPDHNIFAFIGRFVYFKGFDIAVRAFLKYAKIDKNARFLLVGARDPLHPTGLSEEEDAALYNCKQIIDVGWQMEVQRYLSISHVVVLPSRREGLPVSIMESLSMGVPVITSNNPGCSEVVRDDIDGIVLDGCTENSIISLMTKLIEDKCFYDKLVANALAGRERFSRKKYVDEQINIYRDLVSK